MQWPLNFKAPKIMGVINITPDSFSDGGLFYKPHDAINHAQQLIADGVDIIDVGAESTRPFAESIDEATEWQRLKEILVELKNLTKGTKVKISLDTRNYNTFAKGLEYIDILNDVSGLDDGRMADLARDNDLPVIIMHHLGIPTNPNIIVQDKDIVMYIKQWGYVKLRSLEARGLKKENIIFDPGIGFGKNAAASLKLLKHANEFKDLGVKVLIGHSRKSCFKYFDATKSKEELDFKSTLMSIYLSYSGVDYLRVHNVAMHKKYFHEIQTFLNIDNIEEKNGQNAPLANSTME